MSNTEKLDLLCKEFKRLNLNQDKQKEVDLKWQQMAMCSTVEDNKRIKLGLSPRRSNLCRK